MPVIVKSPGPLTTALRRKSVADPVWTVSAAFRVTLPVSVKMHVLRGAIVHVCAAVTVTGMPTSSTALTGSLTLIPDESCTPFPANSYPVASTVSDPNAKPGAKSFVLTSRAAPAGNRRESPLTGAVSPCQLAAVDQLASAPPPSQTRVAARTPEEKSKAAATSRNTGRATGGRVKERTVFIMSGTEMESEQSADSGVLAGNPGKLRHKFSSISRPASRRAAGLVDGSSLLELF